MAARKAITPSLEDFVWPAEALPTFGWWGFNCERLSTNGGRDVVAAARPQLDVHLTPLLLAWARVAGIADRVKAHHREVVTTVRDAAIGEGSGALLDLLKTVGIAVPFADTLLEWGWKGAKAAHRSLMQREALGTAARIGDT